MDGRNLDRLKIGSEALVMGSENEKHKISFIMGWIVLSIESLMIEAHIIRIDNEGKICEIYKINIC